VSFAKAPSALLIASLLTAQNAPTDPAAIRWWAHVTTLAADNMRGRNAGSEEYLMAARYVAGQFDTHGLKPAGTEGFYQSVALLTRQVDESGSSLELVRNGTARALTLGTHAYFNNRVALAPDTTAELVFAGYGLSIPEFGHDDLKGVDLKGKVAVYLAGAPSTIHGTVQAHFSSAAERNKALAAAGATGFISIANPRHTDVPWERSSAARTQAAMTLADPKLDVSALVRLGIVFNPAHAQMLFEGTPHSFDELVAMATAGKPLPRFPLNAAVRAKVALRTSEATSPNVVGVLEGSDPKLKNEYIVLTAHLDHTGVNPNLQGDQIFNGAMDNASGIATLIEVAREFAGPRQLRKPARSIVFAALTGEEKGLLGSRYFAARPTVPAGDIVANINMDMFLPLHAMKHILALGMEESSLRQPLERAARTVGVSVMSDPEPLRNRFIRSDQYNFILRGVPALALKVGSTPGSPEEQIQKNWTRTRYHAVSDDLAQPVDFTAVVTFNRLVTQLVREIDSDRKRPRWNGKSFFKRFAAK
jgi:Zn-dependent M28 family amino/carboxypeptidase